MAMSCGEISERHLVGAADLGGQVVNLAGEPVWGKPFGHGVGIQERSIDFLRRCAEHAVKPDGVCCHDFGSPFYGVYSEASLVSTLLVFSSIVGYSGNLTAGLGAEGERAFTVKAVGGA